MRTARRKVRIILASKSPRRREILDMLGVKFDILSADTDEVCTETMPSMRVEELAYQKAYAAKQAVMGMPDGSGCSDCAKCGVASGYGSGSECDGGTEQDCSDILIIACDTLVFCGGVFLGKPKDRDDARRMLEAISGGKHEVWSGICIWHKGKFVTASESTEVEFCRIDRDEIERYLDSGEPYDKAGAYAVQGGAARYIRGLRGDYFNVVGLPVNLLYSTLKEEFGIVI